MTVASDLATLGWRTDTADRLAQAVRDFQRGWNLGQALTADGNAGPLTQAALAESVARRHAGLPDLSANFSAREFACNCDGRWADCRRIWTPRYVVRIAEQYRTLIGPYTPDRACRCPRENARVGGVSNSQHLYGLALDVPLYAVTAGQVETLGTVSGIGVYLWNGRRYVRHIDARHLRGSTSTPSNPATWDYGTAKAAPSTAQPITDPTPAPAPTNHTPPPEEDMPLNDEDKAYLGQLVEDKVKVAFIEMASRATPVDRQAGTAFWNLTRDATSPMVAQVAALESTVGVLANAQGLDPALVQSIIRDAVTDTLSKIKLTTEDTP